MQTNVLEYLENIVDKVENKIAYANDKDGLTFGQVYNYSRSIGSSIIHKGYYKESVVVYMNKHPNAIAAFYGVIYSGNYYVPIDEEMPTYRIELIFKTLNPKIMICDEKTKEKAIQMGFEGEICLFDELIQEDQDILALQNVRNQQIDIDPIYIVFTSGSTGVPKGVMACHRSVIDYIENLSQVLQVNENTVFGNQSPLYFDACLKELYPTLKYGATAYLIPKNLDRKSVV